MVLIALALAVLSAWGVRAGPVEAAEVVAREEVGDFLIEVTDEGVISTTEKSSGIRYEDHLPAELPDVTEEQVQSQLTSVTTDVQQDLGWQLTSDTDRSELRSELAQLGEALSALDETSLEQEHPEVLELRSIVDDLHVARECRERCLPDVNETVVAIVTIYRIFSKLNAFFTSLRLPEEAGYGVLTATAVLTGLLYLPIKLLPTVTQLRSSTVRKATLALLDGVLRLLKSQLADNRSLSRKAGSSPREEATEGAKKIADLTGNRYDPNAYNLVPT